MNEATLDKRLIAESFSRAAPTYDKAAALQRTVGSNLLGRLPRDFVPGDILDLGCGTGHFTRALAACFDTPVIGLDLAEGMLRHANEHSPGLDHWITADAERLPLRSESRDLIFSSLAMQWCPRLDQALAEAWRVLRPGGRFIFSVTHPIRWCFPDDPGPAGLKAGIPYFHREPYVERDDSGEAVYVEHHRTMGDRVRELVAAGFVLEDVIEPEWPDGLDVEWGQWSPLRGAVIPGTAIFVARLGV